MPQSSKDEPTQILIESLTRTREALEQLIASLVSKKNLSVSDEKDLRRSQRALRKINQEYMPWARLPSVTQEKIAEIVYWLNGIWSQLPLNDQ